MRSRPCPLKLSLGVTAEKPGVEKPKGGDPCRSKRASQRICPLELGQVGQLEGAFLAQRTAQAEAGLLQQGGIEGEL